MEEFNSSTCMPIVYKTIYDLSRVQANVTFCSKMSHNIEGGDVWLPERFINLTQECPKPCSAIEYKGETIKYEGWNLNPGKLGFYMYFASNEMKVQEEYLVYNEVDLVGIVGGNLGLFVGFSFFEKVKQIINFFIDKI